MGRPKIVTMHLLGPLLLILLLSIVTGEQDKKIQIDKTNVGEHKIADNDSVRLAANVFAKSRSALTTVSDGVMKGFEEVGAGPEGGRLLRVRASTEADNSDQDPSPRFKERRLKKLPKATKSPKKAKSPKKNILKTDRCARLIAEDGNWETWVGDVATFAPIFRPATDSELMKIIKNSKKHGCKIRTMGARHTQDGMVMQRTEEDVVVISLASHSTQVEGWSDSINAESSTFRIGAGKSWFDVSALIRPHGFVQLSRTTAQYFSVGGVIANMVHGGGRTAGFIHDDVVKVLVMTSDGTIKEVEGNDLDYWRSSAGLLGFILSVEMNMHSEALPFIAGLDPETGEPIVDPSKGGLIMEREKSTFPSPINEETFADLVTKVSTKVLETSAVSESVQFFYDFYNNALGEYRTNFGGKRFSGSNGNFADVGKAQAYSVATQNLAKLNSDSAFTGGQRVDLSTEALCESFCVPPTGPPAGGGDGSPCVRIPSQLVPGADLCNVPLEVNAALSTSIQTILDGAWDAGSSTSNDGYFILDTTSSFDSVIAFLPARAFATAFATWYDITSKVTTGKLDNTSFAPNGNLEFRFLDPKTTAILNPIPPIDEIKAEFDQKYNTLFGGIDSAYDLLLPPLPPGIPDGYIAFELVNIRGIFDADASKYFFALQEAWSSMPTNPLLPYGQGVVPECDPSSGVLPCQGLPTAGAQCCNPPVPAKLVHYGKGWGYGIDPLTSPTTQNFVPFTNTKAISDMYATGTKKNSVSAFNQKRSELEAEVFSGGSMLRWLEPENPNSKFEVRKLDGQSCGSAEYATDPNSECIGQQCVGSICE